MAVVLLNEADNAVLIQKSLVRISFNKVILYEPLSYKLFWIILSYKIH